MNGNMLPCTHRLGINMLSSFYSQNFMGSVIKLKATLVAIVNTIGLIFNVMFCKSFAQ